MFDSGRRFFGSVPTGFGWFGFNTGRISLHDSDRELGGLLSDATELFENPLTLEKKRKALTCQASQVNSLIWSNWLLSLNVLINFNHQSKMPIQSCEGAEMTSQTAQSQLAEAEKLA